MNGKIIKMTMNLILITLIATSVAGSGFFSPRPQSSHGNGGQEVIVKEGRREVAVEYDDEGDVDTKISISPPEKDPVEDELARAAASVAGVAQDVKGNAKEVLSNPNGPFGAGPRELICDALGKCEHRIAGLLRKAKEKAAMAEEKVKDLASRATHKVEERTKGVRENAGEKIKNVEEGVRETVENVKGKTEKVLEETVDKIEQKNMEGKKKFSHIVETIRNAFWPKSVGSLMGVIQMLGFAMAYGISVWVTFIMSHVLGGMLPRQQFGIVQSKLYPLYFKAMVGSIGLAFLGHLARQRVRLFRNKAEMLQGVNLMGSLLLVLTNLRFLEPRATKVIFEKMKMEKEEGRGTDDVSTTTTAEVMDTLTTDEAEPTPSNTTSTTTTAAKATLHPPQPEKDEAKSKISKLDHRLKQLNSYSSSLNFATLMGLTWHLMYLGEHLAVNR